MSPETQGERGINSPPVPQTRPGLQWAQRRGRPAGRLLWGRRGGKPHRSICPPCGATGRPAPREQLAGCRGLCRAGAGGRRPCRTTWSTDRQHAAGPLLTSRPVAEETQARAPVLSLAQALRQGTTPAFLLGIPRDRGLWAGLPLCSGLQLFLPFLNGSGPAGGVGTPGKLPQRRGLGSQLWKASPSHGSENSLSHWSQTQPSAGHPAICRQPFP